MKVVILAGGFGTRLSEETDIKPKPMIEIYTARQELSGATVEVWSGPVEDMGINDL